MRLLLCTVLLLGGVASAAPSPADEVSAPADTPWTPTDAQREMHRALSARDGSPPCAEIEALSTAPTADLLALVAHVQAPPWVGMRAAGCLVHDHAAEIQPELAQWVSDPGLVGLGILALNALDQMPVEVATAVAQRALASGAPALGASKRVLASKQPALQALVPAP